MQICRLTVPTLYVIIDSDKTVTYGCAGCSSDIKVIEAILFEVIHKWIIKVHITTFAPIAHYFDVNVVI